MPFTTLELTLSPPTAEIRFRPGLSCTFGELLDDIDLAAENLAGAQDVHAVLLASPAAGQLPPATPSSGRLAFRSLESLPRPVIAVIEDETTETAFELILACDIRVASTAATFALRSPSEGGITAGGGTQRLPRLIGRTRATEMILLGERIDATTAHAWGLVNHLAEPGQAQARAEEIAASIAVRGPLAVGYAKEAIAHGFDMSLEEALRYETDLTIILQTTEDRAEGVRAFLEKRMPEFRGR
jgi:enoyl-CoA hydratase